MSFITTNIFYFSPPADGSAPFINASPAPGQPHKNWIQEEHLVNIENVHGKEPLYTLDKAGFEFHKKPTVFENFLNDKEIAKDYYEDCEKNLTALTGASKIKIFDHTVRRHRPGDAETDETKRQPVAQVHVDQTPNAAVARVRLHVPEEAEARLKKRFQIINLWRPISRPAIDYPLALCDYRTVDKNRDLVPVKLIYPDREGETFGVKYNADHKWKYSKEMQTTDIILIKCYDSAQSEDIAIFTPHTSFKDPSAPDRAPFRESIEVRALVFYD